MKWREAARRVAYPWVVVALLVGGSLGAVRWAGSLPEPLPSTAGSERFAAGRARQHVDELAGNIGERLTGTPSNAAAADYITGIIASTPRVRLEVQEASGVRKGGSRATVYRVRNLLARIEGTRPDAILVSSHYDTKTAGPGAGDAATPVAVMLEMMRALGSAEPLEHSVIFLFNDGEELGLLGAHAFLRHPWSADVRAFLNLESAGPGGKPLLFQSGPGEAWLAQAWARSVPYPWGSVLAQDVFQSGAIPSDTDFRIFRDDGRLRGLDVALYEDGWRYHTLLDVPTAVSDGTIQAMGENALAFVRDLGSRASFPDPDATPAVYYDLLGQVMVAYPAAAGRALAIGLIAVALVAVVLALSQARLGFAKAATGLLFAILAFALPVLAAVGIGLIPPALGRAHRWFATPEPAILGWVAGGLAALLLTAVLAHATMRRWSAAERAGAIAWGATVLWAGLAAAGTWAGIGTSYLALFWLFASVLSLVVAIWMPRIADAALPILIAPPLVLMTEVASMFLAAFIPISGRMILAIPFDPVLAALAVIPVAGAGPLAAAWLQGVRGRTFAATVFLGAAAAATAVSMLQFPWSTSRPQRVEIRHEIEQTRSALLFEFSDFPGATAPLRAVIPDAAVSRRDETTFAVQLPPVPASPSPVRFDLIPENGASRLILEVRDGAWYETVVALPAGRLRRWTAWMPDGKIEGVEPRIRLVNAPAILEIELSDGAAGEVVVELASVEPTRELLRRVRSLPRWVSADPIVVRRVRVPIP